jgi:hypothetical protein
MQTVDGFAHNNCFQSPWLVSRRLPGNEKEHWAFGHNAKADSLREPADVEAQAPRHKPVN